MSTLELPWLFRFPTDSVRNHNGLHLELPGVSPVVCLQKYLIGKSSLEQSSPQAQDLHTIAITFSPWPTLPLDQKLHGVLGHGLDSPISLHLLFTWLTPTLLSGPS